MEGLSVVKATFTVALAEVDVTDRKEEGPDDNHEKVSPVLVAGSVGCQRMERQITLLFHRLIDVVVVV